VTSQTQQLIIADDWWR